MKIFRYGGFWMFRIPDTLHFHYELTRAAARAARRRMMK